jgi:hypothetical protein
MGQCRGQRVALRSQGSQGTDSYLRPSQRQLTTMVPDAMVLGASPRLDPGFTQGLACGWYDASPKASCTQAPAIVARRFSCNVLAAVTVETP